MNNEISPKRRRHAVFLDRDGVLNRADVRDGKPFPPRRLENLVILPGVVEACTLLKRHGFLLVVATNQPDVGRGSQSRETVEAMHDFLAKQLPLDRIEVCYDAGDSPSRFRKPAPGMLLRVAADWDLDLKGSFMVGDRWRDIDCGYAAGCTTIFIDYGYNEALRSQPAHRVSSLLEGARWIVNQSPTQTTRPEESLKCSVLNPYSSSFLLRSTLMAPTARE